MIGILEYPDYEDADSGRVSEIQVVVGNLGGVVLGVKASEEDCEARVGFRIPVDRIKQLESEAEDAGWEVRWL